jgi:integrase
VGYAEKRGRGDGVYWRGRYKLPGSTTGHRKYGIVSDEDGNTIRFSRKIDAKRKADAEETKEAQRQRQAAEQAKEHAAGRMTFGTWVRQWLAGLDLDEDTIDNYSSIIENHLLGPFEETRLDEITRKAIGEWETVQREAGYAPKTVRNRRNLLSEILADAADDPSVQLGVNPAQRRRGRGRRAAQAPVPGPDDPDDDDDEDDPAHGKVITDPLGALLIAERCSLLSGRDDEFTMVITDFYTGLRLGEMLGLETRYRQPGKIAVRWQLNGKLARKRPKFGKTRDVDVPPFLDRLLSWHLAETDPQPCPCHSRTYVFRGLGRPRGTAKPVTLKDVALKAGVSAGTVSHALHHPGTVAEATRERIAQAVAQTGYTAAGAGGEYTPHVHQSNWYQWVWVPAVSGWYPGKGREPRRVVPVSAGPWPGVPVRGRGNANRSDACWVPLAAGMTRHGIRHAHRSWMAEYRTHEVLSHDRLGHELGGIAGVYSHPTQPMRDELMAALTVAWEQSLDARLALCPVSEVPVLDRLLRDRAAVTGR